MFIALEGTLYSTGEKKINMNPVTNPEIYNSDLPVWSCNSGTNAMGVTNQSSTGFKTHSMKYNSNLTLLGWLRTQDWIGHGSRRKLNTNFLLKGT